MGVSDFKQIKNGGGNKPLIIDNTSKKLKIGGFSFQLVGSCTCGNPMPLTLHFIPGLNLKSTCVQCKTVFELHGGQFDKSGDARMAVHAEPPLIAPPGSILEQ